jgi:uncharacterized membrane protein YgcG
MRSTIGKRTLAAVALLGLLVSAGRAHALTPGVRDEADFFKPATVTRANEVIKEVKQKYKKDLLVETFRHVPEGERQEATSSDRDVKARFFADWAERRAREEGVNGIYVLITRDPGHVEVAVGNHTRTVFPDEDRRRLVQILLSHFKEKEYDEGLLEAVRYVRQALAAEPTTGRAAVPVGLDAPGLPHQPGGADGARWGLWPWLGIGLAVLLGIWLLSAVVRALAGAGAQPAPAYGGSTGPGEPAGYGPAGGGGGFFSGLLGGLFGAAAGSWLYDQFFRGQSPPAAAEPAPATAPGPEDTDYSAGGGDFDTADTSGGGDGGGDFNRDDSPGGATGAGGDFGGGGFGGDDSAGGDF